MGEKAEYKNARRSRKMILDAFVELIQEKEIDKITVTDIVKRADLNRGTFYAHYPNPRAVLAQIENDIISKMLEFLQEVQYENFFLNPLPLLLKVETYFEENMEFYHKLITTNYSDPFILKMQGIFLEYLANNVEMPDSVRNAPEFMIRAHFFAGGIASTYRAWFLGDQGKSLHATSLVIADIITGMHVLFIQERTE